MHCCLVIALRLHCTACTLCASVQVVVEKAERKYGEFTQTFKIPQASCKKVAKSVERCHAPRLARYSVPRSWVPQLTKPACLPTHLLTYCPQEYERKWSKCIVSNGVLKLVFKPDNDEEGLQVDDEAGKDEASHE